MIKNTSSRVVTLRWNLQDFDLKPGETFDVKKFGANDPKQVLQLEDRFVSKTKGALVKLEKSEAAPEEQTEDGSDASAEGQAGESAASSSAESTEGAKGGAKKKKKK